MKLNEEFWKKISLNINLINDYINPSLSIIFNII